MLELLLILVRGLPGSGKSTFARQLGVTCEGSGEPVHHWETDMFFEVPGKGYVFRPQLLSKAHKWCQIHVKESLKAGNHVVVSNTFTRIWEMQPYLDMAEELNADVVVVTMTGNHGSIHDVPEHAIARMAERWEPYPGEIITSTDSLSSF